jgi:hypothetical protein
MVTAMATGIAMGQWGTRLIDRVLCCNGNGATAAIDQSIAIPIALGQQEQGH